MQESARPRILVVEDSELINSLVCEALQQEGFDCVSAFDGRSALEEFRKSPPDAVVLDLNIPEVHGSEVLRRIKSERPFTVVVVLTGHGSDQTAMEALKLGADDYLTKPFRHARLIQSLQVHMERADLQKGLEMPAHWPPSPEDHQLSRIFFAAPSALIHTDETLCIRAVNRAAARLLAHSPDALTGRPIQEIVTEEVRAGWLGALRGGVGTAKGYEGEVYVNGAGGAFPASVVAVEGPDPGHLILSIRDLTRQKAMEERYYESKKLASLGRVVEGVAHEVRNPLISIGGFARKLLEQARGDGTEGRYLRVVVAEVERLERMVKDIEEYVQFSRQERPQFGLVLLNEVLREALSVGTPAADDGGIRSRFECPADLPPIYADRELMRELFDGLVENAVDAMPGGGDLSIRVGVVDGWVQTRIEDTGIGISEADLEEIFDPFFTSKTSGTGLGLAKAYLIVEDHAGTIDFESTVDRGTTCTVCLPVDRRKVARRT